jgi:diguanylate cyclase (GGDEF)-like protein
MRFLATFASTVSIAVDNAQLYERQKSLAVSDGLTKLFNYRFFQERLREEVGRAKRYGFALSVIILDIDHFKKYNDTYGHQSGDALLQELSGILKSSARENDFVARYGGEEFVYLLQQANKDEAVLFAKRLRRRIADRPFEGESVLPAGMVTVSLGVSSFPEDADDAEGLIHCADKALYEAKDSGRNCVRPYVSPRSAEA